MKLNLKITKKCFTNIFFHKPLCGTHITSLFNLFADFDSSSSLKSHTLSSLFINLKNITEYFLNLYKFYYKIVHFCNVCLLPFCYRILNTFSLLGLSLIECGEALKQMAEIKYALEDNVKQNFLEPLHHLQTKDLKDVMVMFYFLSVYCF